MLEINKIHLGDCLELMKNIEDKSVDCIICDLPYNITGCNWDCIIPIDFLWKEYHRIVKNNAPIILFAQQPFTSMLVMSNLKEYRHQWVWNKEIAGAFALAKIRPMSITEDILIFGKNKVNYYPIMENAEEKNIRPINKGSSVSEAVPICSKIAKSDKNYNPKKRYPKNLISYSKYNAECNQLNRLHPTQKPVALLEYLIKTYSNEGDLILDNCSGSGSLAVAAYNTRRNFICIEKDKDYYEESVKRLDRVQSQLRLF